MKIYEKSIKKIRVLYNSSNYEKVVTEKMDKRYVEELLGSCNQISKAIATSKFKKAYFLLKDFDIDYGLDYLNELFQELETSFSSYFSNIGKKGGNKNKAKGKEYFSKIGKLAAQSHWHPIKE